MANNPVNLWGVSNRALPTRSVDATYQPMRRSCRGDLMVQNRGKPLVSLADEGSYFVATNPTPGTGIAGIAAADGFDATETLFLLTNANTVASATRVYLDFLEIACTVVDTGGSNIRYDMHIDDSTRFSSGGSAITPVNPNMDSSAAAVATLRFGAVVTSAATANVRYLGGRLISSTDLVVDDVIRVDFGGDSPTKAGSFDHLPAEASLSRYFQIAAPPVVLAPAACFLFSVNCASQSGAATWSFNCGWHER